MSAFTHAVECGVDILELDVHMTKCGKIVVSHDDNLKRLTGKNMKIVDTEFSKFPQIQEYVPCHFSREPYKVKPDEDA